MVKGVVFGSAVLHVDEFAICTYQILCYVVKGSISVCAVLEANATIVGSYVVLANLVV